MDNSVVPELVSKIEVVVLIPESTRKHAGGSTTILEVDGIETLLSDPSRGKLRELRKEVAKKTPSGSIDSRRYLPAFRRFDGNMYRSIPLDAWENRSLAVEVVIASALRGVVTSRDPIPAYRLSMAEALPPFGKLNRWWHAAGLSAILAEYLVAVRPKAVVDLLSLEYRESVAGYETRLSGISVRRIDFPGMGRASQPRRGEKIAEILRTGKA